MRASLTVLLLLSADAMAISLQSMRAPLRLRGGDDEDPPNAPVALTREQVIEKLNEIPTFALMGGEGFVALQLADGSGNAICFFIEPDEAQAVLNHTTTGAASGQNLRLACVGLGTAFRLAKGWPDDDDGNKAFASFDGQVKLQGSHRLVDSVSPKLTEMMESENVDTSSWKLPVFICEELQGPTVLPVFLNPRDIRTTWIAAGRQEQDLPDKFVMMDVRMLISMMQKADNAWDRVKFVGSSESAAFANSLIEKSSEAA